MECCGLPEAALSGVKCPNATGHGNPYILVLPNGGTVKFLKLFFMLWHRMPTWKTSVSTRPAPRYIKAQTAGGKTEDKAVGRSRGGLNTKIHAVVDGLGNPVEFLLSAGNDHDSVHAVELLKKIDITGSNVLGDKAYGAQKIRDYISDSGASYTIPPQANCSNPWHVDWWLYKERHLVECFFQQIKWFRRIATRYDKLDHSFLAFIYLAAIMILLK